MSDPADRRRFDVAAAWAYHLTVCRLCRQAEIRKKAGAK